GRGKETLEKFPLFAGRKIPYSGRLDYESEGLLIFSNNGELIQRMQQPEYKMEKEYMVTVDKPLSQSEMNKFAEGLDTPKGTYKPCSIYFSGKQNYRVIIKEGKKRQIRNMFGYFGSRVKRLKRVRIGPIEIGDLQAGEYAVLTKQEVKSLYKAAGLK
ncbi:MAG: pseudouridine synthase, partial [Mucispirillum sp.]|nr:pseudouridine synthase [Mucispirillum sp.]